jgi:SpoVK/Ycf46/Vps4 family AAA+-type ATPase
VRKGRFDEIFFVDLPSPGARLEILNIHCAKRGVRISENDMKALAARCEGFSGAEIEQAVVSAMYTANANQQKVDARGIVAEIEATRPLSVVLGEKIGELRAWAAERTVPAD